MPYPLSPHKPTCCRTALLLVGLLLALLPLEGAWAFNAFTIDAGYGLDDTRLLRLNISHGDHWRNENQQGWYWTRSWETSLSYWYLYKYKEGERSLVELGFTPNFRLQHEGSENTGHPYFEVGLGVHLLSKDRIATRDLGGNLQFGTHMGFGVILGNSRQYELAWRIEHISNAGIQRPDPGINFSMVRFTYRW